MDLKERHNCRECVHFWRVRNPTRSLDVNFNPQGFCIIGQLTGDFSLYCSCSISSSCMGYCYDEYNAVTHKMERDIDEQWYRFRNKATWDRRTKEFKIFKRFASDLADNMKKQSALCKMINRDLTETMYQIFISFKRKEISELYERRFIPIDLHSKIMGNINSVLIKEIEPYLIEKYMKNVDLRLLEDGTLIKEEHQNFLNEDPAREAEGGKSWLPDTYGGPDEASRLE